MITLNTAHNEDLNIMERIYRDYGVEDYHRLILKLRDDIWVGLGYKKKGNKDNGKL